MIRQTVLKGASGMTSKLVLASVCAIAMTGCAQFEDSFGELYSESPSRSAYSSDSHGSIGPNGRLNNPSNQETESALLTNGARGFTVGGIRVELADGQVVR